MTQRENLIAALEGNKPNNIPITIHQGLINDDAEWQDLFRSGLCPLRFVKTFTCKTSPDIEKICQKGFWHGYQTEKVTYRTQVGEISQESIGNRTIDYFLKEAKDYRVMDYIVMNTRIEENYNPFFAIDHNQTAFGITYLVGMRSPMQSITVDYAGIYNLSYHLVDCYSEVLGLYDSLRYQLLEIYKIIAQGPGRYVNLLENLTAEVWGPEKFTQFHMPIYTELSSILHQNGKKVFAHTDGKLKNLADLLAKTDLDGFESVTSKPEGDVNYDEFRKVMKEKIIWANISIDLFDLSSSQLQEMILDMIRICSVEGKYMLFSMLEDLPKNWKTSIPIILDVLHNSKIRGDIE